MEKLEYPSKHLILEVVGKRYQHATGILVGAEVRHSPGRIISFFCRCSDRVMTGMAVQ